MNKFADIHVHSSLKSFLFYRNGNKTQGNIWFQDNAKPRQRDNSIVRFTEADFTTLIQSGIKIAFISLYSFEQGWLNSWHTGPFTDLLLHAYTDFPTKQINFIQSEEYNYFKALKDEINFISEQIKEPRTVKIKRKNEVFWVKIPRNTNELNSFISEKNTLIIIPTIEGANCLFNGNAKSVEHISFNELENNINFLKGNFCPFFVTLAHHFYNGLCGHAKSIFGVSNLENYLIKVFLNQEYGIDNSINKKGEEVIEKLLAIGKFSGEKRILIDVKHMNVKSRQQFYLIIKNHNLKFPDDKIPIIASHMGYSGHKNFDSLIKLCAPQSDIPYSESKDKFNEARINLCDMDIFNIFESEGLIGINMDQRIISNQIVVDEAESKFNYKNTPKLKMFWANQIALNIVEIAKAIIENDFENSDKVWDMFTLGSDFDGFINPVDAYISTDDYKELKKYLTKALNNNLFFKKNIHKYKTKDIVEKIMYKNAQDFLIKNFHKNIHSLT